MRRILTSAFLLTTLPVLAHPLSSSPVGSWCQSTDKGQSCFQYMTFQADGTLLTQGQYTKMGMGFEGDATWTQKGDQTCISETRIDTYRLDTGAWLGEAYIPARCDTVLAIDATHYNYRKPNGDTERLIRVSDSLALHQEFTAGRN
ncbi:hypothetical protein [Ferrimonas futtsuensis]|uniref:hypothetical protein n=1 Tax=Ferrimonas futtsuensis TaxID=364764 RepID=UPI000484482F|nr:hypothetical protein [Ferrimonas futtsuensis]